MLFKIKNLKLKTILGFHAWEENINREIIINAEVETNNLSSLSSDDIKDTIDYDILILKIKNLISSKRFKLVEKMAAEIMREIMKDTRISRCKLEIDKVGVIADLDSFSVTLEQHG